MSPIGSYVGGLMSKGQVGVLLDEHRGWMLHMPFSYKAKAFRTTAFFPLFQHTAFYFPPSDESDGFETIFCLECLQILNALHMAGGRNNKGLLLRDTSHLFLEFIEFPYNWYPGPY